ncbi:hypothetical protein [Fodinibius salsisoli]|uniref:Beta/gamma crystallin 'Greek key' domain-containing protein n=1 Tax=Fodinibius salsisoli TaxID=2820877 RepID=A0ABT3PJK9_9BACT|nr:hypothetical protein [Fodinibius salsisoli]MCW9706112.1 hypothetical protein [Fodinibius salsisoli]
MKQNINKALHAAIDGPEIQRLKVYGHHWNVKPANILRREGSKVTIEGQIDHSVLVMNDDHLFYKFVFENGELKKREINIEAGGWSQIAEFITDSIEVLGFPVPPDKIEEIGDKLDTMQNGEWKVDIQRLALRIALAAYKRMHGITAYTKSNFKGTSQTFTPGVYEADDFWTVGNDRITSIKVPPRMKVLVCRHRPGEGKPEECKVYTKDTNRLDREVMGVSYLSVEDRDNPSRALVIDGTEAMRTEYVVEIIEGSGWIRKNVRQGSVQASDKIFNDWTTARGVVDGGKDAYTFTGKLKKVTLTGDKKNIVVSIDGGPKPALV